MNAPTRRSLSLGLFAAVAAAIAAAALSAESEPSEHAKTNVQLLMRDKLHHAQAVLEGIVTEDFEQIAEAAEWMRMISQAASWQAIDTEDYKRHSAQFRETALRLRERANDKDLDAATLLHVQLTLGCVDCHRYMRNLRNRDDDASQPLPRP